MTGQALNDSHTPDCKVRIWSTAPILDDSSSDCDKLLATLSNHTGAVLSVQWSQTGTLLATGADDSTIVRDNLIQGGAGNVESWRAIKVLFGHYSDVADLAWSPSNEYLASCGLDSLVFIWDGKTFGKLKKLEAHQGFVKGITWDPVGKYLATQSDDKTVKIWRTSDWASIGSLSAVEREITEPFTQASSTTFFRRLSWSPDGSCIAMANGENGNVPVSPIVNRDTWISDVSLAFNPVTFEIEIPDEDGEEGATKRVVSSVCAIAGQDRSVSIWWTAQHQPTPYKIERLADRINTLHNHTEGLDAFLAINFGMDLRWREISEHNGEKERKRTNLFFSESSRLRDAASKFGVKENPWRAFMNGW
ncbi:HIR complex subunit [Chytriomyces hyalinus]|nr:HIR complex subunit [Chytriomyces hyalinus]